MKDDREKLDELCDLVIEASLYWTGKDEMRNPKLKRLRTIAGRMRWVEPMIVPNTTKNRGGNR